MENQDPRQFLQAQMDDAYSKLELANAILTGTGDAQRRGQAEEGDGYRMVNAIADLQRLAGQQAEFWAIALEQPNMEPNAGLHIMAFRAQWLIMQARILFYFARFGTPAADTGLPSIRQSIADLVQVRKEIEGLWTE